MYKDIRHTLCGIEPMAMWGSSKDIGWHSTIHFANFNLVARVWLKRVYSVLFPANNFSKVMRDRVVLIYMLMKGMPINVRAILSKI